MPEKKLYEKEILVPLTTVAGNIKDFKQQYEILYYPKSGELVDKIALYMYLAGEEGMQYAKRSIYFSSHEQLKQLIFDLTKAYFYFRDQRIKPVIPESEFRLISLSSFLEHISIRQKGEWSVRR